jgi:hypothetical protein
MDTRRRRRQAEGCGKVNALKKAVENYDGKDWNAAAALVPSRTKSQCRSGWHNALDTSVDPASSINIASPDAEEAALPPADADPITPTPPNTSVAGTLFSESTLDNEVGLTIRVGNQPSSDHTTAHGEMGCIRRQQAEGCSRKARRR